MRYECPNCSEKTLSLKDKRALNWGAVKVCSACKSRLVMSSLWRWLISFALALYIPIFILLIPVFGLVFALVVSIVIQVIIYLIMTHYASIKIKNQGKEIAH